MPWEDFPPKGLRLLGVDDDAVVDGLLGVVDEPCLSPRVKAIYEFVELCVVGDARAAAGGRDAAAGGRELDPVAVPGLVPRAVRRHWANRRWGRLPLGPSRMLVPSSSGTGLMLSDVAGGTLRSSGSEPCLSPREAISTNSNQLLRN